MTAKCKWSKDVIAQLGKRPDQEIADILGVTRSTVYKKRASLGIPTYREVFWTDDKLVLLGKISDAEAARRFGVSKTAVAAKRQALDIPPLIPAPGRNPRTWTQEEIDLLGTDTDCRVADMIGAARRTVRRKRQELGIPPVVEGGQRTRPDTLDAHIRRVLRVVVNANEDRREAAFAAWQAKRSTGNRFLDDVLATAETCYRDAGGGQC